MKWLVWTNVSLGEAVLRFLRNTSDEYPKEQQNAAAGRAAREEIDKLIGMVDAELAEGPYMLGKSISLVDFHLGSFMQWLGFSGIDLTPFPKVAAWVERCSAREANQKLMAAA